MTTRRALLRNGGIALATMGLAGCSGIMGGSDTGPANAESTTTTETPIENPRTISARPVVTDDLVYVAENHGDLYALDRTSGSVEWRFEMDGTPGAPTVAGDVIYTGDFGPAETMEELINESDGTAYAVNRRTGEQIWETDVSGNPVNTPVVRDDAVHYAAVSDGVHTLGADDGSQRWSHTFDQGSIFYPGPLVQDGILYTGNRRRAFALDLDARETYWTNDSPVEEGVQLRYSMGTDGDRLFVTTTFGLKALSLETGDVEWTTEDDDATIDMAVSDQIYTALYGLTAVAAYDPETGDETWQELVTGDPVSLVTDDESLYVATYTGSTKTGRIYALEPDDGTTQTEISFETSSIRRLAVEDGLCYVGNMDGTVFAIDTEDETVRWETTAHEA